MRFLFVKRRLYIISFIVVLIITYNFFRIYNEISSDRIINYSYNILNKYLYEVVSSYYNDDLIPENNWNELLIVTRNKDNEILQVDTDLTKANNLNKKITHLLNERINTISDDVHVLPKSQIEITNKGICINVPLFIGTNWALLTNLGPRIPIKTELIGGVKTNIKTVVKEYGLNNSLVEIYAITTIKVNIITPKEMQDYVLDYDILLASKLIQGRIPYFYGGNITSEKSVLN